MDTRTSGSIGENYAKFYLSSKGYKILDQNFHSRFGEIDIIAEDKGQIVFVEVKARWSNKFGAPEEAITKRKLSNIIKTAEYYLLKNKKTGKEIRLEVIAIIIDKGKVISLKHIKVD